MTLTKYPLGLSSKTNYFRMLKSVWDVPENQEWILTCMKVSTGNIKPVIVIDDITKKSSCYISNSDFTGFEDAPKSLDTIMLCRKVEAIAYYMINRMKIIKSSKTQLQKAIECNDNNLINRFKMTKTEANDFNKKRKLELESELKEEQEKTKMIMVDKTVKVPKEIKTLKEIKDDKTGEITTKEIIETTMVDEDTYESKTVSDVNAEKVKDIEFTIKTLNIK